MVAFMLAETATVIYFIVLIAALAASYYIVSSLDKNTKRDDHPDTTASRGAIVPRVIGRELVGAVVTWIEPLAPGTNSVSNMAEGGKGGGGGSTATSERWQAGMHVLAQGPIGALHSIREGGKTILQGPITPASHPSGTSITCPNNKGTFRIYWGDRFGPVDATLQAATNFGTNDPNNVWMSTFSLFAYVVWDRKNLGPSLRWPELRYEVEGPCYSRLARTGPRIKPTATDQSVWSNDNWSPTFPSYAGHVAAGTLQQFYIDHISVGYPNAGDIFIDICGFPHNDPTVTGTQGFDCSKYFRRGQIVRLAGDGDTMCFRQYSAIPTMVPNYRKLSEMPQSVYVPNETQYWEIERFEWLPGELRIKGHTSDPKYAARPGIGTGVNRIWLKQVGLLRANEYQLNNPNNSYWPTGIGQSWLGVVPLSDEDGVNPMHLIDDLLFSPWPFGAGLPREHYDVDSMEDSAELLDTERIGMNVKLSDGQDYMDAVKQVLANLGMFISWDRRIGRFKFIPLREPSGAVPEIPDTALVGAPPTNETSITNLSQSEKVLFAFRDRTNNYRTMTLTVKDDGQVRLGQYANAREITLPGVTSLAVARKIALRREQEVYSQPAAQELAVSRDVGFMAPGAVFRAPGSSVNMRALSIKPDLLSSKVVIKAAVDSYSVPLFGQENVSGGPESALGGPPGKGEVQAASTDLQIQLIELPRMFYQTPIGAAYQPFAMAVLRVRAQESNYSNVYLSRDGSSFSEPFQEAGYATGGQLTSELSGDSPWCMEDDASLIYSMPTVSELGIDMLKVENLTGSETSWQAGRQLCLLTDGASIEICYLRNINVESVGYSLSGLIRGRMGTTKKTWPIGTGVYIFRLHEVAIFNHPLVVPGKQLHVKVQPVLANGLAPDLSMISAVTETPQAAALKPRAPAWATTSNLSNSYRTGEDVPLKWSYESQDTFRTAAGLQSAGEPYPDPPVPGRFRLQLSTLPEPGAILHTLFVDAADNYTITNADLVTWFSGEPSSFRVSVSHFLNGYESPAKTIDIIKET